MLSAPDRNAVSALNPRAVIGYLRSKGWQKERDYGDNAAIFSLSANNTEQELIVPTEPAAFDFTTVMEIMIKDMVGIENRSFNDIVSDLSMAAYDVIRIRSFDADDLGSIQLTSGIELHEYARDLVISAAYAAASDKPRAVWYGRRSEQVKDYLNSIRLAQSQRGSFVVSLLSPWDFISSEGNQSSLFAFEPFGRRATKTLADALVAVQRALKISAIDGEPRPFEDAVPKGVSANFCRALAELARDGEGADVSIRWSLTKPEIGEPMLRLRREDAQALTEAAQRLRDYEPILGVAIKGIIVDLKEEPSAFDGVTTLEALIDGNLRRVTVEFSKDDTATRDDLISAFKHRSLVSVVGDLVRDGRRLKVKRPRELSVIRPE